MSFQVPPSLAQTCAVLATRGSAYIGTSHYHGWLGLRQDIEGMDCNTEYRVPLRQH